MRKCLKLLIVLALACMMFLTGCSVNDLPFLQEKAPTAEELLAKVPKVDGSRYNRFMFDLTILAGNRDGDGKDFSMSTVLETWGDMAHMYNTHTYYAKSGQEIDTESWSDYSKNTCWQNLGEGWTTDKVRNELAMDYLIKAMNDRSEGIVYMMNESKCTVSWTFPTDVEYLFGGLVSNYAANGELKGYGRTTAVFDPVNYEFQYFTVVVSLNNEELPGALLDMVLHWDVKNDREKALAVPESISNEAYLAATGVSTDGGYDETVNPLAEKLVEIYKGTADVKHDEKGSYLFWTLKQEDGLSAAVTYAKEEDPVTRFEEGYNFLVSLYGEPEEETEDGAYFYNKEAGELIYMARGADWYAEIVITGTPENSQGELRKPLITYKSRIGI